MSVEREQEADDDDQYGYVPGTHRIAWVQKQGHHAPGYYCTFKVLVNDVEYVPRRDLLDTFRIEIIESGVPMIRIGIDGTAILLLTHGQWEDLRKYEVIRPEDYHA